MTNFSVLKVVLCAFVIVLLIFRSGYSQQSGVDENYDENQPYCFRFTWVGPQFDNSTPITNSTCEQYLEQTNADNVPCRQPLVVTFDGTPPNIDTLWKKHRSTVICRQARGYVCAKYSYSFNSELQNVTYMCTKVFVAGEGPLTRGCYKQDLNGYEVELCVCESQRGGYKPCNGSSRTPFWSFEPLLLVLVSLCVTSFRH